MGDHVVVTLRKSVAEEASFGLIVMGLKVGAAWLRVEGKTKEDFVQMCAMCWDEFEEEEVKP